MYIGFNNEIDLDIIHSDKLINGVNEAKLFRHVDVKFIRDAS